MKKHKSTEPEEPTKSNSTAELFVLPPELLAKLGINLSNIQQPAVQEPITTPKTGYDQNLIQNSPNSLSKSKDASSIIETANLMKESVFLSPTFLQSASNLNDEEEQISVNTNDTVSRKTGHGETNSAGLKHILMCEKNTPVLDKSTIINSNAGMSDQQLDNLEYCGSIKEYLVENQDGNLILTDVPYPNTTTTTPEISNEKTKAGLAIDEHLDEAYLSDCSNSYSGPSPERINSEEGQKFTAKVKEKSGAVVTNSPQWPKVRNFGSSSNNVMTPVMMNSIATAKKEDSNNHVTSKQSDVDFIEQMIIESPVITSNNSETTKNITYISSEISTENIISWTPIDKKEKEIQITKIDYDVHNNSVIHINDSLNSMELLNDTKIILIDSVSAQNLPSNKSANMLQDCHIMDSEKCTIENDQLLTIVQVISDKSADCVVTDVSCDGKSTQKIRENNERYPHSLAVTNNTVNQDATSEEVNTLIHICATKDVTQDKALSSEGTNIIFETEDDSYNKVKKRNRKETNTNCGNKDNAQEKLRETLTECKETVSERDISHYKVKEKIPEETSTSSEIEDGSHDKVLEIAAYLSQIAKEKRRSAIPHSSSQNHNILFKAEVSTTKSKCIQGVEKPGGKLIQKEKIVDTKVIKTYQKTKLPKRIPDTITVSDKVMTSDLYQLSTNSREEKILENKVESLNSLSEFCICYDFGNLAYYDCEMLYEHIHFWQHKSTNCHLDVLYSMYNEDYDISDSNEIVEFVKDDQIGYNDDKMLEDNICWNNITENNNDQNEIENFKISEEDSSIEQKPVKKEDHKTTSIAVSDRAVKSPDNITKTVRNRKRSSVAMDHVSDHNKSEHKNKEEEVHKEKTHNSIAWKEGEEIETNCGTTSEPLMSSRSTMRSTRNSINLEIDSTSCSAKDLTMSDRRDSTKSATVIASNKKITNKEIDASPRSTRRTSKSNINAKLTRDSRKEQMDESSKTLKKEIGIGTSKSSKDSASNKADIPTRSTRSSRSNLSATLLGVSADEASKSTKRSSRTYSHSSDSITKSTDNHGRKSPSKTKEIAALAVKSAGTTIKIKTSDADAIPKPTISNTDGLKKSPKNSKLPARSSSTISSDSSSSLSIKTIQSTESDVQRRRNSNASILNEQIETSSVVNVDAQNKQDEEIISITKKKSKSDESFNTIPDRDNSSGISKESTIEKSDHNPKLIMPACSKILQKGEKQTESTSRLSEKSTDIDVKSPKPTKRSSNTVSANIITKKLKTMGKDKELTPINKSLKITDSEKEETKKVPLIVEEAESTTCEKTEAMNNSSVIKIIEKKGLDKNRPINTLTEVGNKHKKIVNAISNSSTTSTSDNKIEKKCANKKDSDSSVPTDAKVELSKSSVEQCSSLNATDAPCENVTVNHSTLSNNITTVSVTNDKNSQDSQTSKKSTIVYIEVKAPIEVSDKLTKCGVCGKSVEDSKWIEHISKEHDYLAWRYKETPLDLEDEEDVKHHLQAISKLNNGLVCSKCGLVRKFAKPFMRHVKNCDGTEKDTANTSAASELDTTREHEENSPLSTLKSRKSRIKELKTQPPVTCGVCKESVEQASWIEHIRLKHEYLAWQESEGPLDLENPEEVKNHLHYISKYHGGLICGKCGKKRTYVKKYLKHVESCGADEDCIQENVKIEVEILPVVKCGICKLDVEGKNWIKHIHRAHEYLAWMDGEDPLDVNDPEQVKMHLNKIVKMAGKLICLKCGVARKNEHAYSLHVNACINSGFKMEIAVEDASLGKDQYQCGVCKEIGNIKQWKAHAMKSHYNVAWKVGDLPINLRNPYAVEKYLKEYQKSNSLICNHCKATRSSCYGFYAHILTCGKSDEEVEAVHNMCEVCNNKYLCVYRNQHMAMHREQVYKQELKAIKAKQALEEAKRLEEEKEEGQPTGRRRAAQKAKKVIEKINSNVVDGKHVCSCGTTFENATERSGHQCTQKQGDDGDSDVSVKMEEESELDTGESEIDENASDDEQPDQQKKKKRHRPEGASKIVRMPYRVSNYVSYLVQSFKDFCNLHFTSDSLFNDWRNNNCEVVPKEEMSKYLPPLTESCKVKFDDSEWTTYNRFESKKIKGYSLFTGGAIQCISWAPHNIADETLGNYLAVVTHLASDVPRYSPDETPECPGLVQIWDFQQFNFLPRCSLGLAHEYGVVWAIDWCPSGARDRIPNGWSEHLSALRLGLLALACSNGVAYILAVPYPPAQAENENDPVMYKLKPVAELRISMYTERRVYQATTIKWSEQKGHDIIIVGYSDGTTALYDLNTESPILRDTDNDVTIFYPFQDKQSENSVVTGVGLCPTANESYAMGGVSSASITGGTMSGWPSAGPSVRSHLSIGGAAFSAHWPATMLTGDAPFMKTVNELEWWGGGRRLGAARAAAACARCGRAMCAAAPAVRLLRAHPCYPELRKLIVATLLMAPIGQKRKRKVNDDLSVVVEPLTYEDTVTKYGLHLSAVHKNDQIAAQKVCSDNEQCSDRFPLSDVVSAAFCPSARFHEKLALGTQAGIIFIITN